MATFANKKKKKNISDNTRVSVLVSDNKDGETVDANEIDMKITKLNSMIKNVERRIDSHERKLSQIYDNDESKQTRETIQKQGQKVYSGQ